MKIFVGIDIAKLQRYFAAAISSDGEILLELPFNSNDADGQLLVSKARIIR